MGFGELLHRLAETSEANIARQLEYILEQLENDQVEPCASDEEDNFVEESDDDLSYYAEEDSDAALLRTRTGEDLLLAQFVTPNTGISSSSSSSSAHPTKQVLDPI
jgi:CCR4-NOT transcriptional regulation complex NOT5 subunit